MGNGYFSSPASGGGGGGGDDTDGDVDTSSYGSNDDDDDADVPKYVDGNGTRSNKNNSLAIYLLAAI
jgi:hypothetical protein